MKIPLVLMLIMLSVCSGCVVRELTIKSDPPGATVYINGREEGKTPLNKTFEFYGSREITLRMDGYKTSGNTAKLSAPWYEYFPLDFVFEVLLPLRITNRHEYSFALEPLPESPPEELLERAKEARTNE